MLIGNEIEDFEEDLGKHGEHVLVAAIVQPRAGYGYLATAALFAVESSTGTSANERRAGDLTKIVEAPAYYIDRENEETKIVYLHRLVARSITGGCDKTRSCLLLHTGS